MPLRIINTNLLNSTYISISTPGIVLIFGDYLHQLHIKAKCEVYYQGHLIVSSTSSVINPNKLSVGFVYTYISEICVLYASKHIFYIMPKYTNADKVIAPCECSSLILGPNVHLLQAYEINQLPNLNNVTHLKCSVNVPIGDFSGSLHLKTTAASVDTDYLPEVTELTIITCCNTGYEFTVTGTKRIAKLNTSVRYDFIRCVYIKVPVNEYKHYCPEINETITVDISDVYKVSIINNPDFYTYIKLTVPSTCLDIDCEMLIKSNITLINKQFSNTYEFTPAVLYSPNGGFTLVNVLHLSPALDAIKDVHGPVIINTINNWINYYRI